MSTDAVIQISLHFILLLMNVGIGIFMFMLSFSVRRVEKMLDNNAAAFVELNREMGEIRTRVEFAVKHKEY